MNGDAYERQVLGTVLQAYVAAQSPPLLVEWPNRAFNKPTNVPWIRFTVMDIKGQQIETGSPNSTRRVYGSLILQVFVPADSGDGAALVLANTLGELYRQRVLNFPDNSGHVRLRVPSTKVIGNADAYYQVNVVIPFHRDELP